MGYAYLFTSTSLSSHKDADSQTTISCLPCCSMADTHNTARHSVNIFKHSFVRFRIHGSQSFFLQYFKYSNPLPHLSPRFLMRNLLETKKWGQQWFIPSPVWSISSSDLLRNHCDGMTNTCISHWLGLSFSSPGSWFLVIDRLWPQLACGATKSVTSLWPSLGHQVTHLYASLHITKPSYLLNPLFFLHSHCHGPSPKHYFLFWPVKLKWLPNFSA